MNTDNLAYNGIVIAEGSLVQRHSRDGVLAAPVLHFTVNAGLTMKATTTERAILHELGNDFEFPQFTVSEGFGTDDMKYVVEILKKIDTRVKEVQNELKNLEMYERLRVFQKEQERVDSGEDLA